jgi:hypothetical protein
VSSYPARNIYARGSNTKNKQAHKSKQTNKQKQTKKNKGLHQTFTISAFGLISGLFSSQRKISSFMRGFFTS